MSTLVTEAVSSPRAPFLRALRWYLDGLRLWRRALLMLPLLCLASLVVESLLQLIPWVGVTISKTVVPMLGGGLWVGLEQLRSGGRLRFCHLWAGWRQPRWRTLWLVSASMGLVVFAFQLGCAAAWFGPGAIDAVLFNHLLQHPALQTRAFIDVLLLPGLLPSTLLLFMVPLALFRHAGLGQALAGSVRMAWSAAAGLVLAMLPQVLLFALALSRPWLMPLLLVLLPLGSVAGFAAWRDLGFATATAGDSNA